MSWISPVASSMRVPSTTSSGSGSAFGATSVQRLFRWALNSLSRPVALISRCKSVEVRVGLAFVDEGVEVLLRLGLLDGLGVGALHLSFVYIPFRSSGNALRIARASAHFAIMRAGIFFHIGPVAVYSDVSATVVNFEPLRSTMTFAAAGEPCCSHTSTHCPSWPHQYVSGIPHVPRVLVVTWSAIL